jgi:hypothetical protein
MVPDLAVIVAAPAAIPLATPAALMVTTLGLEELHCAVAVRSLVLLSEKWPVAENGCVALTFTDVEAGVTVTEVSVAVAEPPPDPLPDPGVDVGAGFRPLHA